MDPYDARMNEESHTAASAAYGSEVVKTLVFAATRIHQRADEAAAIRTALNAAEQRELTALASLDAANALLREALAHVNYHDNDDLDLRARIAAHLEGGG